MVLVSAFERRKEGRLNRFDFSFEISFEINRLLALKIIGVSLIIAR